MAAGLQFTHQRWFCLTSWSCPRIGPRVAAGQVVGGREPRLRPGAVRAHLAERQVDVADAEFRRDPGQRGGQPAVRHVHADLVHGGVVAPLPGRPGSWPRSAEGCPWCAAGRSSRPRPRPRRARARRRSPRRRSGGSPARAGTCGDGSLDQPFPGNWPPTGPTIAAICPGRPRPRPTGTDPLLLRSCRRIPSAIHDQTRIDGTRGCRGQASSSRLRRARVVCIPSRLARGRSWATLPVKMRPRVWAPRLRLSSQASVTSVPSPAGASR